MSNKIRSKIVLLYSYINKALIFIYSYFHMLFIRGNLRKNKHKYDNRILIVAVGPLGDTLMFMDAYKEIVSFYEDMNDIVTLVCPENVRGLYENMAADRSFDMITIETKWAKWTDFHEFYRTVKKIKKFHYKKSISVFPVARLEDMLIGCTYSKECIKVDFKYCTRWNSIKHYIDYLLYTDIIESTDELFIGKCYSMLLHRLGNKKYISKKPQMLLKKRAVNEKYIIVAPFASTSYRNLSTVQIISILQYLLEKTDYNIYVTGNQNEDGYISSIVSKCGHDRVVDMTDKTDFNEFLHLINDAEFLVGADSGPIHIAAVMNTPSIALIGKYNLGMFLPYDYDRKGENDPVCIYSRKQYPCQNCIKAYKRQKINPECYTRIKHGKNCLCVEKIDMQDIYQAINSVLGMDMNINR